MSTDWDKLKSSYDKAYATPGKYKVKCVDVDIKEVGNNGSIAQKFFFESDEASNIPEATHWLTFKEGKDGWRKWHNRCLMIVLGSSEENAEKAIDKIEALGSKEKIVEGYTTAYKTLLKKKPTVEVEVYLGDGDYKRAEFTDSTVAMPHEKASTSDSADAVMEEDDSIDLSDLPF